jgi:hypothetical protein
VTGKQRRPLVAPAALLPAAVVLGLLLLAWAATTGPVGLLNDSGRRYVFEPPSPSPASPSDGYSPAPSLNELTRDVRPVADLSWVGDLVAVAVLLGILVGLSFALRSFWARRWRPPEAPEQVDFEVLPEQVLEALRRDRSAQLSAVEDGTPRNAIVACWLRLEEVLTAAGLPPLRHETSTEYVVRALHALDLDPVPVGALASLYREARFSEHPVGEDARQEARRALAALHQDLGLHGAPRP